MMMDIVLPLAAGLVGIGTGIFLGRIKKRAVVKEVFVTEVKETVIIQKPTRASSGLAQKVRQILDKE